MCRRSADYSPTAAGDTNGSTIAFARNGDLLLGGYAVAREGAAPDAFVAQIDRSKLIRRTEGRRAPNPLRPIRPC